MQNCKADIALKITKGLGLKYIFNARTYRNRRFGKIRSGKGLGVFECGYLYVSVNELWQQISILVPSAEFVALWQSFRKMRMRLGPKPLWFILRLCHHLKLHINLTVSLLPRVFLSMQCAWPLLVALTSLLSRIACSTQLPISIHGVYPTSLIRVFQGANSDSLF